ncbi:N-6 DNA methylase [Bradyrhizobium sp. BR13661]|uniref:HsdM family class I SAM-dependent methyltransferase n=1 Tax=Bradyrhizobium sp. BR13661 TaxID=2940622 RepID=UPI00247680F0|nr:N-6 DNA methylase [Bradyrhizobium sp. BR13661]MDH6259687.1 adenine-specific DNA-methyltransferase [Bradyrhizobium sp. BR13661]
MGVQAKIIYARELLILARKAASTEVRADELSSIKRVRLCLGLLDGLPSNGLLGEFAARLARLGVDQKHYWVGTFYTLLLSPAARRAQATYFTPPNLSKALIRLARNEGFDPLRHAAIDPAAGGAAFLSTLAGEMRELGASPRDILQRLHGIEIDRGLARVSEALIADRINGTIPSGSVVEVRDALKARHTKNYDLVIANPPYGRISVDELRDKAWEDVCHPGHINKYALFTERCFRLARPNGLVALVLPSSFIAGPLYGKLRAYMRMKGELLTLGSVTMRNDVFVDVQQDVSIVVARVGTPHRAERAVSFGSVTGFGPFKPTLATTLPAKPEEAWTSAGKEPGVTFGGATLTDYCASLRVGYFVWNRQLERMSKRRNAKLDMPLIWARNVRPGTFCLPKAKSGKGIDFVRFEEESSAIIRQNAIILQRTTNNAQSRRLVAARVSPTVLKKWGGFVTENHTLVVTAPNIATLNTLCFLLNSAAVDARYRRLSGTASVSASLLRDLDLPTPRALAQAIDRHGLCEVAIEHAYAAGAPAKATLIA